MAFCVACERTQEAVSDVMRVTSVGIRMRCLQSYFNPWHEL